MRSVKLATLHDGAFFLADLGQLKKTLDSQTYKGIKMTCVDPGVVVEYKNREVLIPYNNFKIIELEPKVVKEKKADE